MLYKKLWLLHILSPSGLLRWAWCVMHEGFTLMALMRFASHYYPERIALVDRQKRYTYRELYEQSKHLARVLCEKHKFKSGVAVDYPCTNDAESVLHIIALSSIRLKIKLIASKEGEVIQVSEEEGIRSRRSYIRPIYSSLTTVTSGSSGNCHEATRQTSAFQFLQPLCALLEVIGIDRYSSVFMPLPLFHGFGLATLFVAFLMGKKVCLMSHFDPYEAFAIIQEEKVEVLTIVPAMLARMWQSGETAEKLRSARCIISGGDRLDRKWVDITRRHLGDILFNLYGTSEAGFFMIATPRDLSGEDEVPIGRPIGGVKCRVDADNTLWVRSGWAMSGLRNRWQNTGDLVYKSEDGLYFHRGRADRMVVCGGENVYADHVEQVIGEHPEVVTAVVYPVSNELFGTVLHAIVELKPHSTLTSEALLLWLNPLLNRAERPHDITFQPISLLKTGKIQRTVVEK